MLSLSSPLLAAAGAAVALACCACGKPAAVARTGTTLPVTLSEYRISPQDVEIRAGRIVLDVHNAGTIAHRLQLTAARGSRVVAASPPLPPGQRTRVVVTLAPGDYLTSDPLDRHDTLGQRGTLNAR
ncbi:MAG: hypothetical protein JWQ48_2972 [Conexibacter sp.]|nr:hypothetical protein [Conexibacter sp.]